MLIMVVGVLILKTRIFTASEILLTVVAFLTSSEMSSCRADDTRSTPPTQTNTHNEAKKCGS